MFVHRLRGRGRFLERMRVENFLETENLKCVRMFSCQLQRSDRCAARQATRDRCQSRLVTRVEKAESGGQDALVCAGEP